MDTTSHYEWHPPASQQAAFQSQYMSEPQQPPPPPYYNHQFQSGGCLDEFGDVFVGGFKPLQVYATPAPMCPPQFQSPPQFHGQPYGGHGYEYGYPPQPANYRHEPPPHVHNPGNQSPASSTLSPFSPDAIPITRTHSPQPMSPLNEGASAASAALPRSIPTTSRSLPPAVNPTGSSGVALGRSNTMSSTHSHQAAMPSGGRKRDRMKGMFGMGGKV